MNQSSLKQTAEALNLLLDHYAQRDSDAAKLRFALSEVLEAAILGQMQQPIAWQDIPGAYLFNETDLRQYPDLESAYAKFKIEATGSESPALKAMRARTEARKAKAQP